jgi:RNA polymerase sigma factor (sigma-70 family)
MSKKNDFIAIVEANDGIIYKVAKIYTFNKEDEQDLYQEIIYQLWKSFDSFRSDSKISTWMYRIALNTSIAHLTKEKRRGARIPISDEVLNKPDTIDSSMQEHLDLLHAQIKELDIIEKGIILLYLEGNSYDEISLITGFSPSNVGTRLGRIKQKIKSQIKK